MRDRTIYVALISHYAADIVPFFAYAKCRFSHDAAKSIQLVIFGNNLWHFIQL